MKTLICSCGSSHWHVYQMPDEKHGGFKKILRCAKTPCQITIPIFQLLDPKSEDGAKWIGGNLQGQ